MRHALAKAVGFGHLYGASAQTIASRLKPVPADLPKLDPGQRVLVKSSSKRPSRQQRQAKLATVIATKSNTGKNK